MRLRDHRASRNFWKSSLLPDSLNRDDKSFSALDELSSDLSDLAPAGDGLFGGDGLNASCAFVGGFDLPPYILLIE